MKTLIFLLIPFIFEVLIFQLEKWPDKALMLEMLGCKPIGFLDANDDSVTPTGSFGQAIAIFRK
jgi:hypothetical protein